LIFLQNGLRPPSFAPPAYPSQESSHSTHKTVPSSVASRVSHSSQEIHISAGGVSGRQDEV